MTREYVKKDFPEHRKVLMEDLQDGSVFAEFTCENNYRIPLTFEFPQGYHYETTEQCAEVLGKIVDTWDGDSTTLMKAIEKVCGKQLKKYYNSYTSQGVIIVRK